MNKIIQLSYQKVAVVDFHAKKVNICNNYNYGLLASLSFEDIQKIFEKTIDKNNKK